MPRNTPGQSRAAVPPFDITAPLPRGTTLLEASAGTGKTWTIAALVTRYVAEGVVRLDEMLVVTFGRAASQELRERVRAQLVEAEQLLAAPPEDPAGTVPDPLLRLLLDADDAEVARRHDRVRAALADFDGATIATTHQFCSLVLDSLGVAGDTDAQARLVEDLEEVRDQVVDDLYLRAFAHAEAPSFSYTEARRIAEAADTDPQAGLRPTDAAAGTPAERRAAYARAVRTEMDRRKRRLGLLSYDDLLSQLAAALEDPDAPARERMRRRWRVVLVDEFQDTDPVQWQVLDRAFTDHATMVLIGDPKQAIYAFRGGDVFTYLDAADTATTHQTLGTNHRSDGALLAPLQTVFSGAELGDPRIVAHDVAARHEESRLAGVPRSAPFRLRRVTQESFDVRGSKGVPVATLRAHVARDLAHDVRALLAARPTYAGRPLEPRDVAVIAYRHADLAAAQQALREVGVPAVIAGGASVFATPAATSWLTLLEGLEQPHRPLRARAAALTPFLGYTPEQLDAGGDDLTDTVGDELREWAGLFHTRGVAAVLEMAMARGLAGRVLATVGGERELTDLRHIGEILHEQRTQERFGLVATADWLRRQVADHQTRRTAERVRRLDSDAAAVQLTTVHGSKGLQYPIVYCPALSDRYVGTPDLPRFHDDDRVRLRDVGGDREDPAWHDAVTRWGDEEDGEWLRLAYVALTRAQCQVVTWWLPSRKNTPPSPLHRLLLGRRPGQAEVPSSVPLTDDDTTLARLQAWQEAGGPVVEEAVPAEVDPDPPAVAVPPLAVRALTRPVDTGWTRTSYSRLTRVAPGSVAHDGVASEPEVEPREDDSPPAGGTDPGAEPAADDGAEPAMAALPVGAQFGSLVHAVLEHADPDAPSHDGDLQAELRRVVDEQRLRWPVEDLDGHALADALVAVCDSPLGPAVGRTLRQVPHTDRLCELEFELPLAGGDRARREPGRTAPGAVLADLAPALRQHLDGADPLRAYADVLAAPPLADRPLRGYLTGSLDLVLRVPGLTMPGDGDGGDPDAHVYFVADYKTNWLAPPGEPLRAEHYRPDRLAAEMAGSDYPLQALLYAVVLHRFLRWRLPGYAPATHLGGVLYLYLRGMTGPGTPTQDGQPSGVFCWQPPEGLLDAVSDLLDGGGAR